MYSFRHHGRIVRLFDTPGFDDSSKPDVHILTDIAYHLTQAYAQGPKLLLSGIIYLHPINQPRMQGTAKKNLTMFRLLCGEESMRSVVLATTMWSKDTSEGEGMRQQQERRQKELVDTDEFWGNMVRHGSRVFKHTDTASSALEIVDHIIMRQQAVVPNIQRQIVDEDKDVEETSAGQEQSRICPKEKDKMKECLQQNQKRLDESRRKTESEETQQLLRESEKYQKQLEESKKRYQRLMMDFNTLRDEKKSRKSTESNEAKIAKLIQEVIALEMSNDAAVKSSGSISAHSKTQAQTEFDQLQMQMNAIKEQIILWRTEQQTLKKEQKRQMRNGVILGVILGALCTVM